MDINFVGPAPTDINLRPGLDWAAGFETLNLIDRYEAIPELVDTQDVSGTTRVNALRSLAAGGTTLTQSNTARMPQWVPGAGPNGQSGAVRYLRSRGDHFISSAIRPTGDMTVIDIIKPADLGGVGVDGLLSGTVNSGNGRFLRSVRQNSPTAVSARMYVGPTSSVAASAQQSITLDTWTAIITSWKASTGQLAGAVMPLGGGGGLSWSAPAATPTVAITQTSWVFGATTIGTDGLSADHAGTLILGDAIYGDSDKQAIVEAYLRGDGSRWGL